MVVLVRAAHYNKCNDPIFFLEQNWHRYFFTVLDTNGALSWVSLKIMVHCKYKL